MRGRAVRKEGGREGGTGKEDEGLGGVVMEEKGEMERDVIREWKKGGNLCEKESGI